MRQKKQGERRGGGRAGLTKETYLAVTRESNQRLGS